MPEMKSLTLNDKTYDSFVDPVARALAFASAMINSASGESLAVSDASDGKLYGLNIYGKTTQDGTPTPDAPVELVSVGEGGSITVSVSGENDGQSITVATPNGLPGIPVDSGGNYTDAEGQQWICDEIDFARGVYVRRIGSVVFDGSEDEAWYGENPLSSTILLRIAIQGSTNVGNIFAADFLCTHFKAKSVYSIDIEGAQHTGKQFYFRVSRVALNTEDIGGFRLLLADSPMTVSYILENPIEIPLSEEELTAYAALHTYRDNTTVTNDASAHMKLEYVMDAKKYLNSLVASAILPATVE